MRITRSKQTGLGLWLLSSLLLYVIKKDGSNARDENPFANFHQTAESVISQPRRNTTLGIANSCGRNQRSRCEQAPGP